MLSYSQACERVLATATPGTTEMLPLQSAYRRTLARQVLAPMDHPFFDQTAVDGYAIRFADLLAGTPLRIVDSIRAGDAGERALGVGEELAHTSLRIGLGRFTTKEEVEYAAKRIIQEVNRLRDMSPLWEMAQEGIDITQIKWAEH